MRIGFDAAKAFTPRDGIATFSRSLLDALLAAEGEHELVLYGLEEGASVPAAGRLRVASGRPKSDEIDVFHSLTWSFPEVRRTPCVFTCYDLTFFTHPEHHTLDNAVYCMTGVLRAHLGDAHFHAISYATARSLCARLDLPEARVRVIHPAVGEVFHPPDPDAAARRRSESFGLGGNYLLSVGTFEPRKNLPRLIEAWRGLGDALRREFPLVLVGADGWLAEGLDLSEVRRLGFVAEDDLIALYGGATVFAYPSLAEGFGLPVLEAMACGAPVLISTDPALMETASDAARRVDPLDVDALRGALAELLGSPPERERLRASGLRRVQDFSWHRTAQEILRFYRSILA